MGSETYSDIGVNIAQYILGSSSGKNTSLEQLDPKLSLTEHQFAVLNGMLLLGLNDTVNWHLTIFVMYMECRIH